MSQRSFLLVLLFGMAACAYFVLSNQAARPERHGAASSEFDSARQAAASDASQLELAESNGALVADGRAPDSHLATEAATASTRAAVAPADLPRWCDLIAPVDHESGAPVADVVLVHVASDGTRSEHALTDAVGPELLADAAVAVLDGPQHMPRFFLPRELNGHVGEPRAVTLAPAGSIEIRAADARALELLPCTVRVALVDRGAARTSAGGQDIHASAMAGLDRLSSRDTARDVRGREVQRVVRSIALRVQLGLDGPPHTSTRVVTVALARDALPLVVGDLPLGQALAVTLDSQERHSVVGLGETVQSCNRAERGEARALDSVVVLHREPFGRLRARLPAGANDGVVRISRGNESERVAVDGEGNVESDELAPGPWRLFASWRAHDGDLGVVDVPFTVVAGAETDLGVLAPGGGLALTVVPRVLLDGRPAPELAAELEGELEWKLGLRYQAREIAFDLTSFAPFELRGPQSGPTHFSMRRFALPHELRGRVRGIEAEYTEFAIAADTHEIVVDIPFESVREVEIVVRVPPSPEGLPRHVQGRATGRAIGTIHELEFVVEGEPPPEESMTASCKLTLSTNDEWTIDVVAVPRIGGWDPSGDHPLAPTSWWGRRTTSIGSEVRIEFNLALAASVRIAVTPRIDAGADGPTAFIRVPTIARVGGVNDWPPLPVSESGGNYLFFGLEPGARYSVDRGKTEFIAPTAGGTMHLQH